MTENMVTTKGTNGEFTVASWQGEAAYRYQEMFYTIKGTHGEFTLPSWQVEAAYRHQLHKNTVMDAKEHVLDYQDTYHYKFLVSEHGKAPIKATEEDYENLADEFLSQYNCDIDDNAAWVDVIETYFGLFQ